MVFTILRRGARDLARDRLTTPNRVFQIEISSTEMIQYDPSPSQQDDSHSSIPLRIYLVVLLEYLLEYKAALKMSAAVVCDSCGKAAPMSCGGCKCVSYCSSECQKKTWKHHKHLCKAIVASSKNSRSSSCSSGQSFGLILDGMGALGDEDYNTKPLYDEMTSRHGMHVSIVHMDNKFITPSQIAVALEKGNFVTCIILGWGVETATWRKSTIRIMPFELDLLPG